jgi:hypothetical protein
MTEIITELPEPDETHRRGKIQRRLRRSALRAPRDAVVAFLIAALVVGLLQGTSWITGEAAVAAPVETDEDAVFSAVLVGDVMFGRHVERAAERHGHDWLLSHVQPLFDADYVSANLEQVVTDRVDELPKADKLIHLASDRQGVEALHRAGVTTLSLANNHMMDHGIPGLSDTLAAIDDIGFEYAGAGMTLEDAVQINYQEHGDSRSRPCPSPTPGWPGSSPGRSRAGSSAPTATAPPADPRGEPHRRPRHRPLPLGHGVRVRAGRPAA